jgi:hypothetical protein
LKLVFEGKISLEGSLEEVKSPLGIFLAAMAKQLAETDETVVTEQAEIVAEPITEAVTEPVAEAGAESDTPTPPSIVSRVLDFISTNPNKTTGDIAGEMGLTLSQVKTAVLTLNKRKQIAPMSDTVRNSGWKMPAVEVSMKKRETKKPEPKTETVDAPAGINNTILDCMRKNPGLTAREIAIKSGMPYDRVTSLVHGLKTANKATYTGKGGHHDPYRYSIAQ